MSFSPPGDSSFQSAYSLDSDINNGTVDEQSLGFSFGIMHQAMDHEHRTLADEYQRPPAYNPFIHQEEQDSTPTNEDASKSKKKPPPPRPPPPRRAKSKEDDVVQKLRVNRVRWFYRDEANKKWVPFIGYDSCQLEWKYRKVYEQGEVGDENIERVLVRGGLYEVDILDKKCLSIFWSDEKVDVMRGTWFYYGNSEPLEESIASQIETEHFAEFGGQKIVEEAQPKKGPKQALKQLRFRDHHVDWNSIRDVYIYSNSTSSRIARSIGTTIGFSKASTSGYRIIRGYHEEASLDDKPPPISHLVFVVHGIGQIMDRGSIIKNCSDLRKGAEKIINKQFPDLKGPTCTKRVEFLPVEWRTSLSLDNGVVTTITPQKLKGLRHVLNSTGMDILYYTSPLYRSEIVKGLHLQLCHLYSLFCSRNPGFEPNGGKVSIFAHSLGSVIVYDILTGWNPIHLYDQYLNHEQGSHPDLDSVSDHHQELAAELNEARKKVAELEDKLLATNQVAVSIKSPKLDFQIDSFFCVGSPLAVFLIMRGFRAQGNGSVSHIIPKSICKRIFNIYHPADPVAYRLEPLMLKHYSTISPLPIHRADSPKQTPYDQMKTTAYPTSRTTPEEMTGSEIGSSGAGPPATASGSSAKSAVSRTSSFTDGVGGFLARFSRSEERDPDIDVLEDLQKTMEEIDLNSVTVQAGIPTELESVELEQRVDFELRQSNLSSTYISALTSHSSYWTSADLSLFMLTQLFPEYLNLAAPKL
ncbi:phospholipase DDHD1-like [Acanthaster planci]|uniref:Phospholipase DDHD1-like n=1 Tax=Acanthaster planci TaxID=133434 RepID=A0A8B7YQV6_ACAPL|nr:phospholipase DDHD1-like [Acanthaster planci]